MRLGDVVVEWLRSGVAPAEADANMVAMMLNSVQLNNIPAKNFPTMGVIDYDDILKNFVPFAMSTDTKFATGFVDRSLSTVTISTRTVTVAPTGANFEIYSAGIKYIKTSCSTTIANTVGLHYVYFDSTGTLQNSMTAWDIEGSGVPVCTVYWNGSTGAVGDERHSAKRNNSWHKWAHDTIGTRYESGLGLTYPSSGQPARTQIESGYIHDEDLDITIAQQKVVRIFYETASATWTWVNGTDNSGYDRPYLWNAGTSRLQYPKSDAAYALTDVDPSKYIVIWAYASSDTSRPIYLVVKSATAPYNNAATARTETTPTVVSVLAPEMKLIYRFIFAGDGTFSESADYRTSSPLPGGSTASVPATQVTFAPSGGVSAVNVQAAIEEVDTEKLTIPTKTAVTFDAGNYTADVGTWTVEAGDVTTNFYFTLGKFCVYVFCIVTTSLSSTPRNLYIAMPLTAASKCGNMIQVFNNSVQAAAFAYTTASSTSLTIYNTAALVASTNGTYVQGVVIFETT